jgi:hypothetical protein
MMFTVIDCDQRSEAWREVRLGRLTSCRAADMLSVGRKKGEESAGRRNLRMQLALERVTGRCCERSFKSAAMQYGSDTEPAASLAWEALTGHLLQRTGFLLHDELMAGCSLDGHVGNFEGIVEIKCPLPATHWETLHTQKVPSDYLKQITHALWISGAAWCDFLSFSTEFPESLQATIIRVPRESVDIAAYELAARLFLQDVDKEARAVAQMAREREVAA